MMMHEESWNAEKLVRTSRSYWEACTLHTAVAMGIFSLLGNEYIEAEDLAHKTNSSTRALSMLLNALAAMGLLIKTGERYANTAAANTFLNKSSPHYCGYLIGHHEQAVKAWAGLARAVCSGKPLKQLPYNTDEEPPSIQYHIFFILNSGLCWFWCNVNDWCVFECSYWDDQICISAVDRDDSDSE